MRMAHPKEKIQVAKDWPSREARRVHFFFQRSEGHSKVESCAMSGFSRRQASRLAKKAATQQSLRDLPRSGRPKVYTDNVFARCFDVFMEQEPKEKWTTKTFFVSLKASGVLHPTARKHIFLGKWKNWLRGRNQHIEYYSTREVPKLSDDDRQDRLEYASLMMQKMEQDPNLNLVFLDETSMEHGQHPKTGGSSLLI